MLSADTAKDNTIDDKPAAEKISVDELAAANAVTTLAEDIGLSVAGDLREATTSLHIKKQMAQNDTEVIAKPQIVQPTTTAERGITSYKVQEGDTAESIAKKFNISEKTLLWANDMANNRVTVGKELTVPRTDGVVYTIKDGDTIDKIAEKYKVNKERLTLYNDLVDGQQLAKDQKIVLPNGDLPETERPGYEPPRVVVASSPSRQHRHNYMAASIGNRYAPGNCTWYAYEQRAKMGRPIGSLWGNAYSWASSARSAGFAVDGNPRAGDIFQTSFGGGGYGHVGIVRSVDANGINVSDMNYGGYNVITERHIPFSKVRQSGLQFIH